MAIITGKLISELPRVTSLPSAALIPVVDLSKPTSIANEAITVGNLSAQILAGASTLPDITDNVSNHRVGINNSSPQYTLDVSGDFNFTGDLYHKGYKLSTINESVSSLAFGRNSKVLGRQSVAFGDAANSAQDLSSSFGNLARANGFSSTALGTNSLADTSYSIAVGTSSAAYAYGAIAIGANSKANSYAPSAVAGIAIGRNSIAENATVSLGENAASYSSYSIALGANVIANGDGSIAIGYNAVVEADDQESVALGANCRVEATSSIGLGAECGISGTAYNAIALGYGVTVTKINSIAIGYGIAVTNPNTVSISSTETPYLVGINTTSPNYTLDVSGNGNFLNGLYVKNSPIWSYGSFYDTGNYSIANSTTIYLMQFGQTGLSNGVTIESTGGNDCSKIVMKNSGVYNIQFSFQMQNSSSSPDDINIWIKKNGQDLAWTNSVFSVPGNHAGVSGHAVPSWNFLQSAVSGDYFQIAYAGTTNLSLASYASGTNPARPGTPVSILTVNKIG